MSLPGYLSPARYSLLLIHTLQRAYIITLGGGGVTHGKVRWEARVISLPGERKGREIQVSLNSVWTANHLELIYYLLLLMGP